jgi:hypothetical protein
MPISDDNPERRNLVITSFAFVVYYLGGGKLVDGVLSIQAISITFEKTYVIGIIAWILLLWFFLRYKQIHGANLRRELFQEVKSENKNKILVWYLQHLTKLPFRNPDGFIVHEIVPQKGAWTAQISLIKGGNRDARSQWVGFTQIESNKYDITWALLGVVRLSLLGSLAINKPSIGSWFVPVVLFYTACGLGVIDFVQR